MKTAPGPGPAGLAGYDQTGWGLAPQPPHKGMIPLTPAEEGRTRYVLPPSSYALIIAHCPSLAMVFGSMMRVMRHPFRNHMRRGLRDLWPALRLTM